MDTLLFIDDNKKILQMLSRRFGKLDYQVLVAASANEGRNMLTKQQIDLICLDHMMPDISGYDFFQEFSKDKSTPVIMMTAHSSLNLAIEFMKMGGADFIEKPIDIDIFHLKIQKAIAQHRALQEQIKARKDLEHMLLVSNQELRTKSTNLEILYADLEEFTAYASHELRSPVRQIRMLSQVIQKKASDRLSEEDQKMLTRIEDSTSTMNELIQGLLNLAKMSKAELILEPVDTSMTVREVVNSVLEEVSENSDKFTFEFKELPQVNADPVLLGQVFKNLISNAIKYSSKEAHPYIKIASRNLEIETVFFVQDNGVGFDPKQNDTLFKGFRRLHDPEDYPGLGIGLKLVKRIVQKHGGKVSAKGEKDKGATFSFTIPNKN